MIDLLIATTIAVVVVFGAVWLYSWHPWVILGFIICLTSGFGYLIGGMETVMTWVAAWVTLAIIVGLLKVGYRYNETATC